jgi:hypothetical protein
MHGICVEITRYVSDDQPGFVECRLIDANGRSWLFVDKVPVVCLEDVDATSSYPRPGIIACEIVSRRVVNGKEIVTVDTTRPWHIESTDGETRFDIHPSQLGESDEPFIQW